MKFLILPIFLVLEFYLTSKIISHIGFAWMMLWFFISFVVGIFLLKNTHLVIASNLSAIFSNPTDIKKLYSGSLFFIVGAIFLIIPGVLSDIVGVLMIIYSLYLQRFGTITSKATKQKKDSDVIDAEIIDSSPIGYNSDSKHSL